MMKRIALLFVASALMVSLSACGKQKQEEPKTEAPAPDQNLALPQKGQRATVDLPPDVKGKWKAIKIMVEDKEKGTKKEMTVALGEEVKIPGSKLSLKAVEFIPSFVMQGMSVTSASNEPTNPAAKVVILEDGKQVFDSYLFKNMPDTHCFTHPCIRITLMDGVKS